MFCTCAARFDVKGISKVLLNFLASEHQNQKILVLEFWWESQGFGFWLFCKILHELNKAFISMISPNMLSFMDE